MRLGGATEWGTAKQIQVRMGCGRPIIAGRCWLRAPGGAAGFRVRFDLHYCPQTAEPDFMFVLIFIAFLLWIFSAFLVAGRSL